MEFQGKDFSHHSGDDQFVDSTAMAGESGGTIFGPDGATIASLGAGLSGVIQGSVITFEFSEYGFLHEDAVDMGSETGALVDFPLEFTVSEDSVFHSDLPISPVAGSGASVDGNMLTAGTYSVLGGLGLGASLPAPGEQFEETMIAQIVVPSPGGACALALLLGTLGGRRRRGRRGAQVEV